MKLHLGRRPFQEDKRDIKYADVRPKGDLPRVPTGWGRGMDFSNWEMLGNGPCDDDSIDPNWAAHGGAGDCVWAGAAHEEMMAAHDAGGVVPQFTALDVIMQYSQYCGYDPQSGANDNGSNVRDVLVWRQGKGLLDAAGGAHKIGTFVAVDWTNPGELQEACWLFEAVGIGINFPDSAMHQFDAGQTWRVVSGAQIEGGHYVPLVGHPAPGAWTCLTWGRRQPLTWGFLQTYCEEAWCYLDIARYSAVTGEQYNGYKDADLEKYLTLVGRAA